ncbi:hypothetical protein CONLIGDRAFT_648167 [Coniochaeta ligniaria NRRL 30616]|uniref:Uncharacterized protein n=1 Tax=Coniochaeta ligniaria NRRL 30616 TaxID=1408157 RepID=A0A1J7JBZ8_9PEZI|nr:hypothetical protein CONLIGDRAFT_648167 [Coniochaeta ligniaria NRRL 30616]
MSSKPTLRKYAHRLRWTDAPAPVPDPANRPSIPPQQTIGPVGTCVGRLSRVHKAYGLCRILHDQERGYSGVPGNKASQGTVRRGDSLQACTSPNRDTYSVKLRDSLQAPLAHMITPTQLQKFKENASTIDSFTKSDWEVVTVRSSSETEKAVGIAFKDIKLKASEKPTFFIGTVGTYRTGRTTSSPWSQFVQAAKEFIEEEISRPGSGGQAKPRSLVKTIDLKTDSELNRKVQEQILMGLPDSATLAKRKKGATAAATKLAPGTRLGYTDAQKKAIFENTHGLLVLSRCSIQNRGSSKSCFANEFKFPKTKRGTRSHVEEWAEKDGWARQDLAQHQAALFFCGINPTIIFFTYNRLVRDLCTQHSSPAALKYLNSDSDSNSAVSCLSSDDFDLPDRCVPSPPDVEPGLIAGFLICQNGYTLEDIPRILADRQEA